MVLCFLTRLSGRHQRCHRGGMAFLGSGEPKSIVDFGHFSDAQK